MSASVLVKALKTRDFAGCARVRGAEFQMEAEAAAQEARRGTVKVLGPVAEEAEAPAGRQEDSATEAADGDAEPAEDAGERPRRKGAR